MNILDKILARAKALLFYPSQFKLFSHTSRFVSPLRIDGKRNISIGKKVYIGQQTWLAALPLTNEKECSLIISDGCKIGNFNHIYATKSIVIEKDVLTADKVYISDNSHEYKDVNIPVWKQPIVQKQTVVIGEGSWLGENVCVMGAKIGKHCIIGANAVVIKDVPDYCIAVGNPARIIKQYNFETKQWEIVK